MKPLLCFIVGFCLFVFCAHAETEGMGVGSELWQTRNCCNGTAYERRAAPEYCASPDMVKRVNETQAGEILRGTQ